MLVLLEPIKVRTLSFLGLIAMIDAAGELVPLLPSLNRLKARTLGEMQEKTLIKAQQAGFFFVRIDLGEAKMLPSQWIAWDHVSEDSVV